MCRKTCYTSYGKTRKDCLIKVLFVKWIQKGATMKRIIILAGILAIISCTYISVISVQSKEQYNAEGVSYKITVDGAEKKFSNPIVAINDRTYLPIRELAEMLGYDIEWKEEEQLIQIISDKQENGEDWLVFRENQKYGYINKYGEIKIDAQFDLARDFIDGVAIVGNYVENPKELPAEKNNIRWGIVNTKGEMVTPIEFLYASDFSEGLALVNKDGDSDEYYIDKQGNRSSQKVIGSKFFSKGFAPKLLRGGMSFPMPNPPSEVWSYIDNSGELVTDKEFEEAEYFENGLAIVKNNGKYGVIDTNFDIVIDYKYDDLTKVDTTLFAAKKGDKWGVIDTTDKVLINFDYFYIGSFSEGIAPVRRGINDGAYIDKKGKIFLDSRFSMVYNFVDGVACVVDKSTGKAGVIDRAGKFIIEPRYYSLIPSKSGLLEAREQKGLDYYYLNLKGEKIIPH